MSKMEKRCINVVFMVRTGQCRGSSKIVDVIITLLINSSNQSFNLINER